MHFAFFAVTQDDEDIEWKYARGELYMEFIQDGNTLPYPVNIVPSPKTLAKICMAVGKALCGCGRTKNGREFDKAKQPEDLSKETTPSAAQPIPFPVHNALAKRERTDSLVSFKTPQTKQIFAKPLRFTVLGPDLGRADSWLSFQSSSVSKTPSASIVQVNLQKIPGRLKADVKNVKKMLLGKDRAQDDKPSYQVYKWLKFSELTFLVSGCHSA